MEKAAGRADNLRFRWLMARRKALRSRKTRAGECWNSRELVPLRTLAHAEFLIVLRRAYRVGTATSKAKAGGGVDAAGNKIPYVRSTSRRYRSDADRAVLVGLEPKIFPRGAIPSASGGRTSPACAPRLGGIELAIR